ASVAPVIDHPDEEKERAGREPVVEHLINAALHSLHVEHEESQHDETEMADGGISDELLDVGLHHRYDRAVNDSDHRERYNDRRRGESRVGKKWYREAEKAVGSELEQDCRENNRAGGRRFDVGIRQPGMKWKKRYLNGEGKRER